MRRNEGKKRGGKELRRRGDERGKVGRGGGKGKVTGPRLIGFRVKGIRRRFVS